MIVTTETQVTVNPWPEMVMPEREIKETLTYLAYKVGKPVRVRACNGELIYSENCVVVCAFTDDQEGKPKPKASNKQIVNDSGGLLAVVDHNCSMLVTDILGRDDEAARAALAHVAQAAIPLLDFDVAGLLKVQKSEMRMKVQTCLGAAVRQRLSDKTRELTGLEYEARDAYQKIVGAERRKPYLEHEIKMLERLSASKSSNLARQQAEALMRLQSDGVYEEFTLSPDGSLFANTGDITIHHDGYTFPLGRYRIEINPRGEVFIENLDEHPNATHPHPHVSTDHKPCLGNITADVPKLIGQMRFAEALQVLHLFLSSYNPGNPYEKIGAFDPTGTYVDEDENPCENCADNCSPYCIRECRNNDGYYDCPDCVDYRSDYCYNECTYNEDFELVSPCEDCQRPDGECYLECEYNDEWQLCNPCDDCESKNCEECDYFPKKEVLNHGKQ